MQPVDMFLLKNQVSLTAMETIESKLLFEREALSTGFMSNLTALIMEFTQVKNFSRN